MDGGSNRRDCSDGPGKPQGGLDGFRTASVEAPAGLFQDQVNHVLEPARFLERPTLAGRPVAAPTTSRTRVETSSHSPRFSSPGRTNASSSLDHPAGRDGLAAPGSIRSPSSPCRAARHLAARSNSGRIWFSGASRWGAVAGPASPGRGPRPRRPRQPTGRRRPRGIPGCRSASRGGRPSRSSRRHDALGRDQGVDDRVVLGPRRERGGMPAIGNRPNSSVR